MNQGKFKQLERRVGGAVERTASNSRSKWMKKKSLGSGFPVQKTLKGAHDTSWSKQGGGYNVRGLLALCLANA